MMTNKNLSNLIHQVFILLLVPVLLLTSCKTSKKLSKKSEKMDSSELIDYINQRQIQAEWFKGKAKIGLNSSVFSINFNALIKMRKDSIVWTNGKKLGMEGGRAIVNQDSMFAIDRINNAYYAKSLSFLSKHNLPADLKVLQHLVWGNPPMLLEKNYEIQKTPTGFHIIGKYKDINIEYFFEKENLLLQKMILWEKRGSKKLSVNFGEYALLNEKMNFAYLRDIELIDGKETITLQINFTKVEIDIPQEFKFDVPTKYRK